MEEDKQGLDPEVEDDRERLKEIQEEYDNRTWEEITHEPFQQEEKTYCFCCDTIGQDRALTEDERNQIESYVTHFANSWTEMEKKELQRTLDEHVGYLAKVKEMGGEEGMQSFLNRFIEREQQAVDSRDIELAQMQLEEEAVEFEQESARVDAQKQIILDPEIKNYFLTLKKYRVLLHKSILQNLLYFLGYTKQDVNITHTNDLDWKKVVDLLDDDNLFARIEAYDHRGEKPDQVKPYAYINRLQETLK